MDPYSPYRTHQSSFHFLLHSFIPSEPKVRLLAKRKMLATLMLIVLLHLTKRPAARLPILICVDLRYGISEPQGQTPTIPKP